MLHLLVPPCSANRKFGNSLRNPVQRRCANFGFGGPERVRNILQTGIGIPEKLNLPPGTYEVKFAVRDNPSGLLGTVSVPIEIK